MIYNNAYKAPDISRKMVDYQYNDYNANNNNKRQGQTTLTIVSSVNTSGCTTEACSLQSHKAELAAAGYEIIGVSKDRQAIQKKFADEKGLEFPLIADTETTLLQALGCWGEKVTCGRRTIGILRTTYLVNEDGVVERIYTPKEIKAYKNDMFKLLADSDVL